MPSDRPQVEISFVDPDTIAPVEAHLGSRGKSALWGLLLIGAVLVVYARVLGGGFIVLDDQTIIQNMPLRALGRGLVNIWLHPIVSPHYQPVAYTLYLLEFKIFKTTLPSGYLLVNILLHLGNVLLFWLLLRRLEVAGALVAALIFAVHPINVQAVSWISQQPMLLCAVFSFLAIFVWLRLSGLDPAPPDMGKIFRLPTSPVLLLLLLMLLLGAAMASHSIAVVLPIAMLVVVWWERARIDRRELRLIVAPVTLSLLWIIVTMVADQRRAAAIGTLESSDLFSQAVARLGAAWGYIWHALVPIGISVVYPKSLQPAFQAAAVSAGFAVLMLLAWRLRPRLGRGPFAAVAMIAALLLPALLFRTDLDQWTHRADQLFYLPSAILILLVAAAVAMGLEKRPMWVGAGLTVVVASLLAVLSILRIGDFQTSARLWQSVLRTDPHSVIALNQLGMIELVDDRNFPQARERFQHALEVEPGNLRALLNMAHSYELEGEPDRMLMRYQEAQAAAPDNLEVLMGLGSAYAAKGNFNRAIDEYQKVLERSPDHYQATYRLALAYRGIGDAARAVELLERANRLNPAEASPYIDLANIAFTRGELEKAVVYLEAAAAIDPGNFRIYVNIGAQLGTLAVEHQNLSETQRQSFQNKAEGFLRHAVRLNPDSSEARYNLGGLLFNRGRLDEAVYQLTKAVELSPRNGDFRRALQLAQQTQRAAGDR